MANPPAETAEATITPSLVRPSPALTLTTAPTQTAIPDTGWEQLQPGLERRLIRLFEGDKQVEQLYLLRLAPAHFTFDLVYESKQPKSLAAWQVETGALIVVNGGYYLEENETFIPTGLTIVDGQPIGRSYGDFAGMVAITAAGLDLRWLRQQPYRPEEPLQAALQSFPLLIKPGGELGFPEEFEDGRRARRTVIAQDQAGQLLLIVASQGFFTLHQLSLYLFNSDLKLDIALNLDGGPSSGLLLADPAEGVPALSPLPLIIAVWAKE